MSRRYCLGMQVCVLTLLGGHHRRNRRVSRRSECWLHVKHNGGVLSTKHLQVFLEVSCS